jgi:hypothetical protein
MKYTPEEYVEDNYGHMVGLRVTEVRAMTTGEASSYGWDISVWKTPPMMIFFDNGMVLIPSADAEGNESGHLFFEQHRGTKPC